MSASQLADDSTLVGCGNNNNGGIDNHAGWQRRQCHRRQEQFANFLRHRIDRPRRPERQLCQPRIQGDGDHGQRRLQHGRQYGHDFVRAQTAAVQPKRSAWRGERRRQAERTSPVLISDVVDLSGMTFSGSSGQTSPFVLQMNYNPVLAAVGAGSEGLWASNEWIYLGWLNPNTDKWENAVLGNYRQQQRSFRWRWSMERRHDLGRLGREYGQRHGLGRREPQQRVRRGARTVYFGSAWGRCHRVDWLRMAAEAFIAPRRLNPLYKTTVQPFFLAVAMDEGETTGRLIWGTKFCNSALACPRSIVEEENGRIKRTKQ